MDKTSRLITQAAFDSLRKTKTRWVSKGFAMQAAPATFPSDKIGFCVIASKKTAKSAVERNRMRRRLKAVALEILPRHAVSGQDYMIVARKEAATLEADALKRDMIWCLKRLNLLKNGS
ncbi:MAG TPA: ribonuclease P protein component [Alphaproteobacteria bacterium]|nr:ribonuclease P protein component [Alphaproteobacteria bacterium]HNS43974.1 ribonuclease P protein component [Alphaproteobacteria bacterium]